MVFSVPSSELQPLAPLTQKLEQGMMINSEGFLGGEQSDERLEALTEVADERVVGLIDDEDDFASNLSLFRENEAVSLVQICGTPAKNLAYKQLEGAHVITPEKTTGGESVPPVSTIDTPVTPKKTTFLKRVSPASNNETPVKKGKGPLISRSPVEARHLVLDNDSKRLLEERFARESLIRRAECRTLGNSEHQIRILQQEISKVNQVRVQEKEDFIRLIKSNGWEPQRAFIDPAMQKIWNVAQGVHYIGNKHWDSSSCADGSFKATSNICIGKSVAIDSGKHPFVNKAIFDPNFVTACSTTRPFVKSPKENPTLLEMLKEEEVVVEMLSHVEVLEEQELGEISLSM